jgi:hypothetical protein
MQDRILGSGAFLYMKIQAAREIGKRGHKLWHTVVKYALVGVAS